MKKKSVLVIPKDKYHCFPRPRELWYIAFPTHKFSRIMKRRVLFPPPITIMRELQSSRRRKRKMSVVRCLFLGYLISRKSKKILACQSFRHYFRLPEMAKKCFHASLYFLELYGRGGISQLGQTATQSPK